MIPRRELTSPPEGHPLGGLFVSYRLAALLLLLPVLACTAGSTVSSMSAGPGPQANRLPNPLQAYRQLGFIVGDPTFAAVGRFVYLAGPADSVFVVFALSLPNNALRFRRDPPGLVARYLVDVTISDSLGSRARLEETQEVRVRAFRETSRRDESVIFQGILKLMPGNYRAKIEVRDLGSAAGLSAETDLVVPNFEPLSITAPILAYQVEPRGRRESEPTIILSPRSTVEIGRSMPAVYVESYLHTAEAPPAAVLEALEKDEVLWTDTLSFSPGDGSLHTALTSLAEDQLPPGGLTLQVRFPGTPLVASGPLLVALMPDWLFVDYEDVLEYLRYAGTPAELDSLRQARPRERARRLHTFWNRRDSITETPENEFFEQYFRRIQEANERFSEATLAGWLTARGEVYVTLGPPDEVFRHLDPEGQGRSQVWVYSKSLGFELRLVFVDENGLGAFRLTPDSRRALSEAVQRLYS